MWTSGTIQRNTDERLISLDKVNKRLYLGKDHAGQTDKWATVRLCDNPHFKSDGLNSLHSPKGPKAKSLWKLK